MSLGDGDSVGALLRGDIGESCKASQEIICALESNEFELARERLLVAIESRFELFESTLADERVPESKRADILAVFLMVSSTASSRSEAAKPRALPAGEILSLVSGDSHKSGHRANKVSSAVHRAATTLSLVVANERLPSVVRCAGAMTLVSLAIPSAYFQEEGKFEEPEPTKSKKKRRSKNRNKAGSYDHNDVSIDALTKRYAEAVNALISCTVQEKLLQRLSRSLDLEKESLSGSIANIVDCIVNFTQILLQNSTQNYAILRKHLSRDCPDFVPCIVLPRLLRLLTVFSESSSDNVSLKSTEAKYLRPIMAVLSLVTVITFKVKTMRKHIAEAEVVKQVIQSGKVLAYRPRVLAMLFKLQVNIEGGYGPKWKIIHADTVKLLSITLTKALATSRSVLLFRDALRDHQAVPCNKGSRAFASVAFAWRLDSLDDIKAFVPNFARHASGPLHKRANSIGISNSIDRPNSKETDEAPPSNTTSCIAGNLSPGHEFKFEDVESQNEGLSKRIENDKTKPEQIDADLSAAASLAPALSQLRLQEQERYQSAEVSKYADVNEDRGGASGNVVSGKNGNCSADFSSREGKIGNNAESITNRSNYSSHVHSAVDTRGLEMDEMDELLLGLAPGPPPQRFLCGLTGNVMSDPIQHPRGNIWVDREALEAYVEERSVTNERLRWPGTPDEPFMPATGVGSLPTDAYLQSEILAWQLRKRGR